MGTLQKEKAAAIGTAGTGVDSRQYIFSFAIDSLSGIPADFAEPFDLETVLAGVFLPRDDAGWLGRQKYPARVLLLTEREIVVAAHPSAREPLVRVPLGVIRTVECGRILLLGWIALTWDGGQKRLPYNTRTRGPVEKYLKTLKDRWLPASHGAETGPSTCLGEPLNLKFEYARSAELLAGETPLVQFFHPPACQARGWSVFRQGHWSAGDLLVATSRRLLWITDRYKGRYECYGTTSLSAPLESIADVGSGMAHLGTELKIGFRSGHSWHIPFRETEEREARKFEKAIWRVLNEITPRRN